MSKFWSFVCFKSRTHLIFLFPPGCNVDFTGFGRSCRGLKLGTEEDLSLYKLYDNWWCFVIPFPLLLWHLDSSRFITAFFKDSTEENTFLKLCWLKMFLTSEVIVNVRTCFQGGRTHRRSKVWYFCLLKPLFVSVPVSKGNGCTDTVTFGRTNNSLW